jgi:TetR/AcrR family transcriptional repressor of mexCD-oprJ operon
MPDGPPVRGSAGTSAGTSAGASAAASARTSAGKSAGASAGGSDRAPARRADARRNIAAILEAALDCLARDPQASIADIAAAAGVGRITLYGHFSSRLELLDATFGYALEQADQVLDAVDLSGDPRAALTRLIATSWQIIDRYRGALTAAGSELPPERVRAHHGQPMSRVEALLERGQQAGAFRTDLPLDWLVTLFYTVMHGAAAEITAGRLPAADADRVITATLLAAYTPPDGASSA